VLRTNADVTPLQAILRYRELLQLSNSFARARPSSKRVRSFIHRTPPSAAMSSAPSLPSCCRSNSRSCPECRQQRGMEDAVARTRSTERSAHAFIRQGLAHSYRRHTCSGSHLSAGTHRSAAARDRRSRQSHPRRHERTDVAAVQGVVRHLHSCSASITLIRYRSRRIEQ
jgi:hypothetical protein